MSKQKVEYNARVHGDALKSLIRQASDHKAIMESGATAISELKKQAKNDLGVDPKKFNALFKIYHKDEREKFEDDSEELIGEYDALFGQ